MDASAWIFIVPPAAIAIIVACIGFNQPSWARSFTSARGFAKGLLAHAAAYVLGLLIVYAMLRRGYSWTHEGDSVDDAVRLSLMWGALGVVLPSPAG